MVLHVKVKLGGLVKWDHTSMAWMSQEFDSPILHQRSLRLSVRTRGFHPRKRGSTPLGTAKWSISVAVNTSPCHGEDHGFDSRMLRQYVPVVQLDRIRVS